MIEEYYDNGGKHGRGVNGSMNGDSRKNGISLTEFEDLCANLKAQQVSFEIFTLDITVYRSSLSKDYGSVVLALGYCMWLVE